MTIKSKFPGVIRHGRILLALAVLGTLSVGRIQAQAKAFNEVPDLAGENLTLERAIELALQYNPSLQGYAAATSEAQARAAQMGRGLNPELSFEAENFAGSGAYNGFDSAELTLEIAQTFELGGKRARAQEAAGWQADLVRLEAEISARDLRAETTQAFTAALAAQVETELAAEMVNLAVRDLEFTERRVRTGTASEIEANRARIAVATARLSAATAGRTLTASRIQLAALWGADEATFGDLIGDLADVAPAPGWEELSSRLPASPRLKRWDLEGNRRRAEVAAEAALGKIDLTAAAGIRHYQDDGENAAVASISIPLPVRNRNQDGKRAAEFGLARLDAQRAAEMVAARSALAQQYEVLITAQGQITTLRNEILPLAERAVTEMDQAYRKGLFKLTDVLAVRRTWFEARGAYTAELARYHNAAASIAVLLGDAPIESPLSQEND